MGGDRELHPGEQQLRERFGVADGVKQRAADVGVQIADPRQCVRRIHDARPQRELLHPVPLALVDDERWGPFVYLEDESWPWHGGFGLLFP
jgi:hypothetical protein